ncbi:adenylate kinase family protein [Mesoterricola sediminis]|uniref:Adenylate kinase n=1 Tax=Mesoterricola sediminis TaxID=2927980 RepID=A0AA48H830_9BACT|nr:nucleoside monophosphate kinase [Mesoterricola sediminis]BDU77668.1 adenylate kinase [Mesoterricola sediminis]
MRIVLLGAPGAGKGTVARALAAVDGSQTLSTGDLLRAAVKAGTPLGREAEGFMARGDLVPDRLIKELMEAWFQAGYGDRFILDGFPRTIPQAVSLGLLLKGLDRPLDRVVNLVVPEAVLVDRLSTRRTCFNTACNAIYNIRTQPPAEGDRCRLCGAPVVQREDETPEAIARRLQVYGEQTAALVGHYERTGLLLQVRELETSTIVQTILGALTEKAG